MSNKDRIKALEHRVDGHLKSIWGLSDRLDEIERRLAMTPPAPKRSLADEAKARAADLGDRVLRAVGL